MQRSLAGRPAGTPHGYDWAKVPLSSWMIDPDFDADNEDFIASLIADVAHGHTIMADGDGTLWGHPPATVKPWRHEPTPAKYLQYVEPEPQSETELRKVAKESRAARRAAERLATDKAYAAKYADYLAECKRIEAIEQQAALVEAPAYLRHCGVDWAEWTPEARTKYVEQFRKDRARGRFPGQHIAAMIADIEGSHGRG